MSKKLTTEEWVAKARAVHGDRYDYSKVEYINGKTKVCIICPEHGEFWQIPRIHANGSKCPRCVKPVYDKESFIQQSKKIHGDKYDYSKVDYIKSLQPVTIVCPEHGEFTQRPSEHLQGSGCPECARLLLRRPKLTQDEALNNLKKVRGESYDYSKMVYNGNNKPITLICREHGEFSIIYSNAVDCRTRELCPYCCNHSHFVDENHFIAKSIKTHGEKYDYSNVSFKNMKDGKVCIVCPIHGEFWQTPSSHVRGYGCRACGQFTKSGSIGEMEVSELLKRWGFMYETQKAYPSKTNPSGFLYVDFYIPSLNTVIEYNGEQHYRKVGIWEERFEKQQARDEELRQYCKDNGIKLIEIRYDEDVWEVLNEKLPNNNDK